MESWSPNGQAWSVQIGNSNKLQRQKHGEFSRKWYNFWLVDALKHYCNTTGLHGFNYITRSDTTRSEKIFWIIVVIIAIITAIVLVVISSNWSSETPTVTVIESTHFNTWNVPFPAVSICNFNKISKRKAMQQARMLKKPPNITVDKLAKLFLRILDFVEVTDGRKEDYKTLGAILAENNISTLEMYEKLAPDCDEMLRRCVWKGTETRCDTLFQTANSSIGICCSFNNHGTESHHYSLRVANAMPSKPRHVTGSGFQTGLTVILNPRTADYFSTLLSGYGFRIFIHNAYDHPGTNSETKVVSSKTENFISITPESTYATSDLRQLSPKYRGCLFRTEQKMDFMKYYSHINCLVECRARLFYEVCGCIPLALPNNGSHSTCRMEEIDCVLKNRNLINAATPSVSKTTLQNDTRTVSTLKCNCLPDCELNQYPAEIATGALNREFSYNSLSLFKDLNITSQVVVHVYFDDLISTRFRKDIYQNWISTLASLGGLLGLIFGFSIVTAFELAYYLSLRPLFRCFSQRLAKRRGRITVDAFRGHKECTTVKK